MMISQFFYPNSIAVIGATDNPKKFGNAVTINILKTKELPFKLYLVSHGSKEIDGIGTYKSIAEIEHEVEIAILLVPAKVVESVVDDCIDKGVKGIIIVTSGFSEVDEKGRELEKRISLKCKSHNIRLIGPNCVGIQNIDIDLNASFIQSAPKGEIGMISQSGSFGCATFYEMVRENMGCSKFANLGNMIDVDFQDVLNYYINDEKIRLICLYLETMENGVKFISEIKRIIPHKPIIILKGGKTRVGMKAASSHTGSIATNYSLFKTAVKQAGGVLCETARDYITALKTFSFLPLPQGEKIGILTNSGGNSVLFSDQAELLGLQLAEFSKEFKEKISPHIIPLVKKVNPLDMIAVAAYEQYYNISKIMLEDPNIDIVVGSVVIPPFLEMNTIEHYKGMVDAWNETNRKKPLIPLFLFSEEFKDLRKIARKENSTLFFTPRDAAFSIKLLIDRMNYLRNLQK